MPWGPAFFAMAEGLFAATLARELTRREIEMTRKIVLAPYIAVMIVLIVTVDVLFLRHLIWTRLFVNIGIVLVSGAFYFIFLTRHSRNQKRCMLAHR